MNFGEYLEFNQPLTINNKLNKVNACNGLKISKTMKICTCNNCGNIFEDLNASDESIEYKDLTISELELLNEDNESYFGCGVCQTDGYLVDNINYHAMSEKQKTNVNYLFINQ